jgi:hypothetical protein
MHMETSSSQRRGVSIKQRLLARFGKAKEMSGRAGKMHWRNRIRFSIRATVKPTCVQSRRLTLILSAAMSTALNVLRWRWKGLWGLWKLLFEH